MDELRYRYFVTGVLGAAVAVLIGWLFTLWRPKDSAEVANWVQAVGGVVTIAITLAIVFWQRHADVKAKRIEADRGAAELIVGLQHIAHELRQMCDLGRFQKVDAQKRVIYPDTAVECNEIVAALRTLPLAAIAREGLTDHVFKLRRIAARMSTIFDSDRDLDGEQFVIRYRNDLDSLKADCRILSIVFEEVVRGLSQEVHERRVYRHL